MGIGKTGSSVEAQPVMWREIVYVLGRVAPAPHGKGMCSQPSAHTGASLPSFWVFSQALGGIGHFRVDFTARS